ncbi:MAG: TolC family protein [Treponema sp.]|jgi:outer membrane protein TolC|nr:TolC family protein [Treponema sp.]
MRFFFVWAFLGFLSLGLAAPPLGADQPGAPEGGGTLILSLEDAVSRALDNSLNLKKSLIDLSTADYSSKRLWAEIFPSLSGSLGLNYQAGNVSRDGVKFEDSNFGYSASFGLTFSFNAGVPYAMKLLQLAYQIQLLSYEDASRQLEIETAKSFYTLIAGRENLTQLEEAVKLAEQQLEKNQTAFRSGTIPERTLLQSQLSVETARYNFSTAQTTYSNQTAQFLSSLGIAQGVPVALEGGFAIARIDEDPEELIREYLPRRPDIVKQRQEIERLEYTEKQGILSAKAPSLSLQAQWRGGSGNEGIGSDFTDSLSGSASLSIPISPWIPGTRSAQQIRSAGANVEKARLELKNIEDTASAQIRSYTASLRNSWNSLEIARLRVSIAERTYELTDQGFRNGAVDFLDLETIRNDLASARQQLLERERDYQITTLDLAKALNRDWRQFTRSED